MNDTEEQWIIIENSESLTFRYFLRKKPQGYAEFVAIIASNDNPNKQIIRFEKSDRDKYHSHWLNDSKIVEYYEGANSLNEQIQTVLEEIRYLDKKPNLSKFDKVKINKIKNKWIHALTNLSNSLPNNFKLGSRNIYLNLSDSVKIESKLLKPKIIIKRN